MEKKHKVKITILQMYMYMTCIWYDSAMKQCRIQRIAKNGCDYNNNLFILNVWERKNKNYNTSVDIYMYMTYLWYDLATKQKCSTNRQKMDAIITTIYLNRFQNRRRGCISLLYIMHL